MIICGSSEKDNFRTGESRGWQSEGSSRGERGYEQSMIMRTTSSLGETTVTAEEKEKDAGEEGKLSSYQVP